MDFKAPEDFFYKLNQVFSWVLAAPLLIFIILYLEWRGEQWNALIQSEPYQSAVTYLLVPLIIALTYFGYKGFRESVLSNREILDLKEKLNGFADAFIRMQLFFTVSALISMVGLYLSGSNIFAIYYLLLLFFISLNRPSPQVISKHLRLQKEQREILLKKLPFQNES